MNSPVTDPALSEGVGTVLKSLAAQVAATQAMQETVSAQHAPLLVAANYLLKCVVESQMIARDRLPGENAFLGNHIPGSELALQTPETQWHLDAAKNCKEQTTAGTTDRTSANQANDGNAHDGLPKIINFTRNPCFQSPAAKHQKSLMDHPDKKIELLKKFDKFLDLKNHKSSCSFFEHFDPERYRQTMKTEREKDLNYHEYQVSFHLFASTRNISCGKSSVIYPDSSFRIYWDLLAAGLICLAFFTVPMELSFDFDLRDYHDFFYIFFTLVDMFFVADIVLNFNTAFYKDGILVPVRHSIVRNYLSGWFIIDLISSFPYSWVIQLTYGGEIPGNQAPKLLRMLRIGKFMRLFKVLRALKLGQYSENIFYVLPEAMVNFITFLREVMKMLVFCHLLACLWHAVGGLSDMEDSWIGARGLDDAPLRERYISAVYYALTTATTVGYGDITPQNKWEEITASFVMVVSVGIFSSLMGNITAITFDSNLELMHVQKKVRSSTQFMKRMGVPVLLRRRVQRYVKHVCEVQVLAKTEDDVLGIIGGPLQDELISNVIKHALKRSVIFRHSSDEHVDACCLAAVCARFEPGNFAVIEGMQANGLWILISGRGQLVVGPASEPLTAPGSILNPGNSFGEWSLLKDAVLRPSPCGAQCVQHCDFVHILRDEFLKIAEEYPGTNDNLKRVEESAEPWGTGMPCALCLEIGHCALDCTQTRPGDSRFFQGEGDALEANDEIDKGEDAAFETEENMDLIVDL